MRRLATISTMHVRQMVAVAFVVTVGTTGLSRTLRAQRSAASPPASAAVDTTAGHGPAFFTVRASDGEHVDARSAPPLQRRISLTLIGTPIAVAVQAIADRAGVEASFSPDAIPSGAWVSMHADDVTVAAALGWVLAKARVDVLVQDETHLTLVPRVSAAAVEDSSGVLAGQLVDSETSEPVPYGTVTLVGTEIGRFTDPTGHFRVAHLPARRYILRARQIGYAPVDSTVGIARDSTTGLTIRMHRVPAMLRLVRVTGQRTKGCVATGIPDSTVNPTLAAFFTQLRENVDRHDLLLKQYPFRYVRVEQQVVDQWLGRYFNHRVRYLDTVSYGSTQDRRPYRVGGVIYPDSVVFQDSVFRHQPVPGTGASRVFVGIRRTGVERRRVMYVPTFADLVDPAFLAAHCFEYDGTTGKGASRLIRLNFEPAMSIKTPDVSGSVYLDADSLVLRQAVFHMTKSTAAEPPVIGFTVTTTFRDILPLVPIVDSAETEQPLQFGADIRGADRLIGFTFEGPTPGEQPSTPLQPPTNASAPGRDSVGASPAPTLAAKPDVRLRALFPTDKSCRPTPPVDTLLVILYGTLHGRRPRGVPDSAWSMYTSGVLSAFSQSFSVPEELSARTFSWPFARNVRHVAPPSDAGGLGGEEVLRPGSVPSIDSAKPRSGALSVVVLDDAGDPVPFAAIRLAGTTERLLTDSIGFLRMRGLYPGTYLLEMRRIGYVPRDTAIVVGAAPGVATDTIYTDRLATRLAVVDVQGRSPGPFVAPMISTAVTITLGADGSLKEVRLTDSSTSQAADSLVLAAVRRTAATGGFPRLAEARDHRAPVTVDLVVSMAEPAPGDQAAPLARLDAPAWPSVSAAHLAEVPSPYTDLQGDVGLGTLIARRSALDFVVSDRGDVLPATVRFDNSAAATFLNDNQERYTRRLVTLLRGFRFEGGRIAGCRVPEFVELEFGRQGHEK